MTGGQEYLSGSVQVEDGRVVLTVAGEVDMATLTRFQALIDEAVLVGAPRVVVDLADVQFLSAGGLGVLVGAAQRVRASGAALSVSAVPPGIYRLFEKTGLTDILAVGPLVSAPLPPALVGLSSWMNTHDVLDAALKLVVTMAHAVVSGADGVSITLPRHGRLGTVAASNDVVLEMDHDQYDTGEGPCLAAATSGERFQIPTLRTEQRWPAFVPRARARGIEAILSTPLVTADRPVGALNIYSRTADAFAEHETQWADQFASEAAAVVSTAQPGGSAELVDRQIQQALRSREVIAMAQGVLMNRDGISAPAAYVVLTGISRRTSTSLAQVSEQLLTARGAPSTSKHPGPT